MGMFGGVSTVTDFLAAGGASVRRLTDALLIITFLHNVAPLHCVQDAKKVSSV